MFLLESVSYIPSGYMNTHVEMDLTESIEIMHENEIAMHNLREEYIIKEHYMTINALRESVSDEVLQEGVMQSVTEFIKKIWDGIIKMFRSIGNFFARLFGKTIDSQKTTSEHSISEADNLETQLKDAVNPKPTNKTKPTAKAKPSPKAHFEPKDDGDAASNNVNDNASDNASDEQVNTVERIKRNRRIIKETVVRLKKPEKSSAGNAFQCHQSFHGNNFADFSMKSSEYTSRMKKAVEEDVSSRRIKVWITNFDNLYLVKQELAKSVERFEDQSKYISVMISENIKRSEKFKESVDKSAASNNKEMIDRLKSQSVNFRAWSEEFIRLSQEYVKVLNADIVRCKENLEIMKAAMREAIKNMTYEKV